MQHKVPKTIFAVAFLRKSPTGSNAIRKIPINYFGKLEIPNPWMKHMPENKASWRERAVKEEAERNAKAAAAEAAAANEAPATENEEAERNAKAAAAEAAAANEAPATENGH
uniref:HMG box domain-containing protein n=1 Tax=Panagrellus redivivus TaxID=6233 RepID=A0A7E4VTD7_PANRE